MNLETGMFILLYGDNGESSNRKATQKLPRSSIISGKSHTFYFLRCSSQNTNKTAAK